VSKPGPKAPIRLLICCCLAAPGFSGCARQPTLVPVQGAGPQNGALDARIGEDSRWPVLLRGVDGTPLGSHRIPTPFFPYQYLVPPGRRVLWVMSPPQLLAGTPIPVGRVHCYTIDAELRAGAVYRLREDRSGKQALLVRADGGDIVARGPLVDQFFSGTRRCRWRQASEGPAPLP
jgi:hypothetical protein